MLKYIANSLRRLRFRWSLPPAAKQEISRDRRGLPQADPGIERAVDECVGWLARAQDNTASGDDGVARDFSLINGWATSYPETTGYIIPTLLEYARRNENKEMRDRARRMADWFVRIQLDGGGYQGGKIDSEPVVPVTFNSGQILLGLSASVAEFGDAYRPAMRLAADWLVESQDEDGCWRKFPTPFAARGEKAYETHVSWGLFEAARLDANRGYGEAGLRNVYWAISKQRENGWFDDCCLSDPGKPLTHTLGYVLRGVLEAHRFSGHGDLLASAVRTASPIVGMIRPDGYLPGRFDSNWRAAVPWVCLTGSVQIAHCLFMLYRITDDERYRDAGFALTGYVRRSIDVEGRIETRGGVKGSFPVDGGYGSFEYLNWAAKFFIDANLLEGDIREMDRNAPAPATGIADGSERPD